jgi:hypothetical protein
MLYAIKNGIRKEASPWRSCKLSDVRVLRYSLSITHDRSNSAIFLHSHISNFHKFSLFSTNYLSKTGQCQLCASMSLQWRRGCSKSGKIRSRVEPAWKQVGNNFAAGPTGVVFLV